MCCFYLQDIEPEVECDNPDKTFMNYHHREVNVNDSEIVNTHESSGNWAPC